MVDDDKQIQLQELITRLAKENSLVSEKIQAKYIHDLQEIYQNNFRHMYSGLFGVLTQLDTEMRVCLEQNLLTIYQKVKEEEEPECELSKGLRKLYDHISLDVSRMGYWEGAQQIYGQQFEKTANAQVDLAKQIRKQKKKLEKAKNEYITILGIFAAIILGAVGSLTYAGKVLEGASNQQTDLTRLIIIAMVLGAVLVSVANTFLSFILKVNGKEECFKGWSWSECMWLIVIAGAIAIGAAKLLGV